MRSRRRRPLGEMFAELNESHFGGRLPAYACRRVGPRIGRFGELRNRRWGTCDLRRRRILVLGMLPHEHERRVLLHEMCHAAVALDGELGHGPRFRAEMARLSREHGETWAESEEYAGEARS